MKVALRLATACLFACLTLPQHVQAGGDLGGEEPYEIGEKLLAKKNYKTALKYFQKSLKPGDVRGHYMMGLIYEETGRDGDALGQYRRFVELGRPEDGQRGDAVQRIGAIEERLKKEVARSQDLLERGKSLLKKGNYREAEKVLLQAISKDKKRPELHFTLGDVYLKLEAYEKAESEYKKAKAAY
jgi:Tfp pilus assembly protein PilF